MKYILFALFYQAIVAVNTAVILNSIIWMAKRKDEKDGRKPNPDFTPPTRHSGGYQPKPSGTPKPPTTGTNVIEPKPPIIYGRTNGKRLYLEQMKEVEWKERFEALKAVPVSVYNPAEEGVKRYERNFIDAKCEKCRYFRANYAGDFGYCVRNDEIKHQYEAHGCFEKREEKDHERQNL